MKSTKGHGYFRKSKAYGLIAAIALSGALYVSNGTSLAEETTVTPKTEAVSDLGEVPHVPSEELAPGVEYDKNIYTLLDPELKDIAEKARDNRVGLFRKGVINKGKVTTKEELEKVLNEIKEEQKVVKEQIEKALPIQIKRNEIYDKALNAYNDYYNFVKEEVANGNVQKKQATAWPENYPKDLILRNILIAEQATSYKKDLERRIEQYKQDKKSYYIDEIQDFNEKAESQLREFWDKLNNDEGSYGAAFLNSIRGNKENDSVTGLVSFETVNFSSFEDFSKIEKDNEKVLEEAKTYANEVHKLYKELNNIESLVKTNNRTQSDNDYIIFLSKGNIIEEEKEVSTLEEANKIFEANKNLLSELNRNPKQTLTFYKIKFNQEKFTSSLDPKKGFKIKKLLQARVVVKPGDSPVLKPKNTHEKVFFNDYVITYALPASETDSNTDKPVEEKPNTDKPVEEKPNTDKPVEEKPNTDKPLEEKPNTDKPVEEKPNTDKPVEEKPNTDKPVEEKPNTDKPVEEKPNTDKPVEEKPNTDKPVEEKPNTDKPVEEKPNTDKPVEEKPNTDKPVEEKPNTDKPVEEKPNTDKPVEEKPNTENKITGTAKQQILPTNNQTVKNSEKATPTKTPTTSTTIGVGLGLAASSILTMLGLAKRKKD